LLDGLDQAQTMGKLTPNNQHRMIGQDAALALLLFHDGNLARIWIATA
jgi:hypothetical protein